MADPRLEAALAPLPDGAPDPAALRYEPDFEALDGAIRRAEKDGPAAVEWPLVARQAQAILAGRSKDWLVACWLAHALARTEGLPGLALGLGILDGLVERHWAAMFPPVARARARGQAIEWLSARTAPLVPASAPEGEGTAALAVLDALSGRLDALVPGGAAVSDLLRALRPLAEADRRAAEQSAAKAAAADAAAQKAQREAAAAAASPPASTPPAPAPAPPVPVPSLSAGTDASATLHALREAMRGAALAAMAQDPADARPYALLRAITWLDVTELPPSAEGRTALLPPPATRLQEFAALRGAGNHAELSATLEKFVSGSGIFWLDGQRMAHEALRAQGPRFAAASRAVAHGTAVALAALPGLAALSFQDGTPFADAATQAWIEREAQIGGAAQPTAKDDPVATALASARARAGEGDAEGAVALLSDGLRMAASGRARFAWRAALVRLALDVGQPALALPLAEEALREARLVAEWEPDAVAEAALLLARALAAPEAARLQSPTALAAARAAAWAEVARRDPTRALTLPLPTVAPS